MLAQICLYLRPFTPSGSLEQGQVWGLPLMMQTLGDSLGWKLALLARLQPGRQLWLLSWVSSLLWHGNQDWYQIDG